MHKKLPKLVQRFFNILWASLPPDWEINYTYQKGILFLSILVTNDTKIRRRYSHADIKIRHTDIWGMAKDCASEIKRQANKNEQ